MMRHLVSHILNVALLIGHLAANRVAAGDTVGMARPDTFALFMAGQPTLLQASRLTWEEHLKQFAAPEQAAQPVAERVKQMSHAYQRTLLRTYRADARFEEMFTTGTYNCVTATALYAMTFSRLGISYEVKELPTHVFLIVSPKKQPIVLETTDEQGGVYLPMPYSAKHAYVNYLYEHGRIREEDYQKLGVQALFDKYFFTQKKITTIELIGIYHSNLGTYAYEAGQYRVAALAYQQALALYPGERMQFHLEMALEQHLEQASPETREDVALLQAYANLLPAGRKRDRVLSTAIESLAQTWLLGRANEARFRALTQPLVAAFPGNAALNGAYHRELSRAWALQGMYEEAMTAADTALLLQPTHLATREVILTLASAYLRYTTDYTNAPYWLDGMESRYAFLEESPAFLEMKVIAMLGAAGSWFRKDNPAQGFASLDAAVGQAGPNMAFREAIAQVYSEGAACYVRLDRQTEALAALKAGLALSPENALLHQRMASLGHHP